ncbi:hypothetical protein DLJ58_26940, partial [Micromonospora arida]
MSRISARPPGCTSTPAPSVNPGCSTSGATVVPAPTGFAAAPTGFAAAPTGFAAAPTGFAAAPTGFAAAATGFAVAALVA